ncbi:arylsulfatase [Lentimicrobium sp. S6]|uniref:sulfatase family protein n=1 Tax=Lentimicrobium sp. S6 TaxID=2735872 RepID=UPI00155325F4|nr:arylsulfatase [Lentimicrobium sp. S6]NPD47860.1 arylsulfatase [Lentimicrobium sp. S6]
MKKKYSPKFILTFVSICFLIGVSIFFFDFPSDTKEPPPNILIVFTDDVGWGDPGCYNPNSKIPTPNIDRLAVEGIRFTQAHAPVSLCAPTRYSMLTGNYPWRGRNIGGTWGFNVPSQLKPGQKTIAQLLEPAGYRSAMFGKSGTGGYWGIKPGETPAPIEWGFDYSYLIPRGHQAKPFAFFENGICTSDIVNDSAVDWDASKIGAILLEKANHFLDDHISNYPGQPFFIHFCTDGAHEPYTPSKTLAGKTLLGATKMTHHTDMVYETDILLGALLDALEKRNLRKNTLVVYTSDNGGIPRERFFEHDAVAGLRGMKGNIYEGGHRVPFITSWPEKIASGKTMTQTVGIHDIVATAVELSGQPIPKDQVLDAVSLAPILLGRKDDTEPIRSALLVQSTARHGPLYDGEKKANAQVFEKPTKKNIDPAVRNAYRRKIKTETAYALYDGNWKLIMYENGQPAELYNLQNDLGEEQNLINKVEYTNRIQEMANAFKKIKASRYSTPR